MQKRHNRACMKPATFPLRAAGAALFLFTSLVHAAPILAPGDFILGGRSDGTSFLVASAGTTPTNPNTYDDNLYPPNESPDHVIDGVGQKYLNFAELNTGFLVTPSFGGALNTVVTGITIWTANDAPERDPASYQLFGTNAPISGPGPFLLTNFTLISAGPLIPPATRQPGGSSTLLTEASQTINFINTANYDSYLLLFPTVSNEPAANSMQVGEVQFEGTVVPEPSTLGLLGLSTIGLVALRRRRF